LALAAQLQAGAGVDACRDANVERVRATASARAVAVGARARDDRALPVAGATGLGDGEEALLEPDLSGAATLRAHGRLRTRRGAGPVAGGAAREARDREGLLDAARGLLEGDLELVLQVLTAPRTTAPTARATGAEEVAEEVAQDVLEAGAD